MVLLGARWNSAGRRQRTPTGQQCRDGMNDQGLVARPGPHPRAHQRAKLDAWDVSQGDRKSVLADRMIVIKRIYPPVEKDDGYRVLVDRLWPRGIKKSDAGLDNWLKDIGPSDELRKWFNHDVERWEEFRRRYQEELSSDPMTLMLDNLREESREQTETLLYAARDERRNNAVVIRDILLNG